MKTLTMEIKEHSNTINTIVKDGRSIIKKTIGFAHLIELLNLSCKSSFTTIGELPVGYVNGRLAINAFTCLLLIPGRKAIFNHFGKDYLIPYPNLLFYFNCKNGKLKDSKVFSIKDETYSDKTILYNYPFSNVYESGDICWGDSIFPKLSTMKDLENVVNIFLSSSNNNDLYSKLKTNLNLSLDKLLTQLDSENTFPTNILTPSTFNRVSLNKLFLEEDEI